MLIPSALTHGTLERRLCGALEQYGKERTALAVEWVREEFPLPARGRGEPMAWSPPCFFTGGCAPIISRI